MAFYVCTIIGDGLTPETAFRPAIADHVNDFSVLDGRADATQATGRMLVRCEPNAAAEGDPRCIRVTRALIEQLGAPDDGEPDEPTSASKIARRFLLTAKLPNGDDFGGLDTRISEIPVARRQRITNRLETLGFDTSGIRNNMTIRDALRLLIVQSPLNTRFCD